MPSRRDFHKLSIAAAAGRPCRQPRLRRMHPAPARRRGSPPGAPRQVATLRPEVHGTHGIVAAGRHYTVEAGTRILAAGGNAFDAGVAAVFAAAVNEISHFGMGGEAPAIVFEAASGQGHRHLWPGHGAEGGDARTLPCGRCDSGQRSERRHGAGRDRCDGAHAAELRHDVAGPGAGTCHTTRRRLSHVRRAAPLADSQSRRHRTMGMGAPHLLSRGPRS